MKGPELTDWLADTRWGVKPTGELLGITPQEIQQVESGLEELEPKLAFKLRRIRRYALMNGPGLIEYRVNVLGMGRPELVNALKLPRVNTMSKLARIESSSRLIDPELVVRVLKLSPAPPPFTPDDLHTLIAIRGSGHGSTFKGLSVKYLQTTLPQGLFYELRYPSAFNISDKMRIQLVQASARIRKWLPSFEVQSEPPFTRQDWERLRSFGRHKGLRFEINSRTGVASDPSARAIRAKVPSPEDGYTGNQLHDWMAIYNLSVDDVAEMLQLGPQLIQFSKVLGEEKIPGLVQLALDDFFDPKPKG